MTDNDLRELKVCLAELGLHVSYTSDLAIGYLRFPGGDGQLTRYSNKNGDYVVVNFPGNPNGYYLNGKISDIAEWIVVHRASLSWEKSEKEDDVTKEILDIRASSNIYRTPSGKVHVTFDNAKDVERAWSYLSRLVTDIAERYSLKLFTMPLSNFFSFDVFLFGENGIKFELIQELIRFNYPRRSQFDKAKLTEKYAAEEGLLWTHDFVLTEAFPTGKRIELVFPVATELLAEDEVVVRVHTINPTMNSLVEKKRKSNAIGLPDIPMVKYIETPEKIEQAKVAKKLCKKLYNPKSPLSFEERNEIIQSLWDMANDGNLKVAQLLADNLHQTMIQDNNSWPIFISDPIGELLAKEKALNLGIFRK